MNLLERVERSIRERSLFRRGERIVVAVSGGLDSTVLLHLLQKLTPGYRWKLAVAHLNHRLRGRRSDLDERFVRELAARFGLPCIAGRAEVRGLARTHKLSLEMAARRARHEFLARAARQFDSRVVAVGHHSDDQVELFFLRVLRGAGGEGLQGMKWKANSPADARIELVRPLLDVPRAALLDHALAHKLAFRKDASNDSIDILRNRVRHRLLPILRREFQPSLDQAILRLMKIVGEEAAVVREAAEAWLRSRRPPVFESLPTGIQRAAIRQQLIERGVVTDFELVERLTAVPNRRVSVGTGLSVWRDLGGRVHLVEKEGLDFRPNRLAIELHGRAGEGEFGAICFTWRITRKSGKVLPRPAPGSEYFDADVIGGRLTLRHWQAGDRFQPIGLPRPAKLQDLLTNARVPATRRRGLIVAEGADGRVFWVEGLRIGESYKLTAGTNRRLHWRWQRR